MDILESWRGATAVIATMHSKERVIAPRLEAAFGVQTVIPQHLDTDSFGTFTREVKRPKDQLETARLKALAGIQETGARIGIASEGSFGPHPSIPFVTADRELVVLIDTKTGLEVVGEHITTSVPARGQWVTSIKEAVATAALWGFPTQGIIIRTSDTGNSGIYKNITTEETFTQLMHKLLRPWWRRRIYLETDMRAHRCPARMEAIGKATENLIANINTRCPACAWPGFSNTITTPGLPCATCGTPTDLPATHATTCTHCKYEAVERVNEPADPAHCSYCNP